MYMYAECFLHMHVYTVPPSGNLTNTRVRHACACTKFYVRARAHYAYVIPLLISWASVIAKEAPFSSVYCYCNAMPAAAL